MHTPYSEILVKIPDQQLRFRKSRTIELAHKLDSWIPPLVERLVRDNSVLEARQFALESALRQWVQARDMASGAYRDKILTSFHQQLQSEFGVSARNPVFAALEKKLKDWDEEQGNQTHAA